MTLRTLRNWKKLDPAALPAPPGRPRLSAEVISETRSAVEAELGRQGWSAGEEPIARALVGTPRSRVRQVLAPLKAERRKRRRAHAERARISMVVHARDAVWAIDATHLGRDVHGKEVQAEVVRDVASTRTIQIAVGLPATDEDVVTLLERTRRERGGAPLVLLSDNGGTYTSDLVRRWCIAHGVIPLFNLPRTPQHNAACEHGMRELKEDTPLGKGALVLDVDAARELLEQSRERIDENRLRRTRGWVTAVEADRSMPPWSAVVSREQVLSEVACAIEGALLHCKGKRARRRAVREAILSTLQELGVITRIRDGRPWTAANAEDVS